MNIPFTSNCLVGLRDGKEKGTDFITRLVSATRDEEERRRLSDRLFVLLLLLVLPAPPCHLGRWSRCCATVEDEEGALLLLLFTLVLEGRIDLRDDLGEEQAYMGHEFRPKVSIFEKKMSRSHFVNLISQRSPLDFFSAKFLMPRNMRESTHVCSNGQFPM